ncbi:hypothetical protein CSKR_113275 [Clonorchis sinensis]|uniref:Uncharacterized protein n=1 Tax=Clonorchis sinensis TaxID=79923 RepID=A0A419QAM4_CLOSI|nr:hypothetical protein CSKR_113275 [Clonorchis sinensis]
MINNNRSVYTCCDTDLCLDQSRSTSVHTIQPVDTAITSTEAAIAKFVPVVTEEENNLKPMSAAEDKSLEPAAENASQHLEVSSPATDHASVWNPSFSMSIICGLIDPVLQGKQAATTTDTLAKIASSELAAET